MRIDFEFDHNQLNITQLHALGIRKVVWLEQVIQDDDTQFFDITHPGDVHPIHVAVGFDKSSHPIKCVFEVGEGIIRSLYARLATKKEVIAEFCRFC